MYYRGQIKYKEIEFEAAKSGQDYLIEKFKEMWKEAEECRISEAKIKEEMVRFKEYCEVQMIQYTIQLERECNRKLKKMNYK